MSQLKSGVAIATAAAALFTAGLMATPTVQAADMGVKCVGANSCKGHSECKTAKSECKGQNSCKGTGWKTTKSEKECTDAGGKVDKKM
jgi:hypothetical protein